ncbi:hypothetical protein [Muribaculum intestinale]|uniref:hypothetical protein n=1 Tax=Muribaculum intestinale TaxID=1796646 RepID=UPI0025B73754|nr:hypothetical protein [Muribaculum intestinale]
MEPTKENIIKVHSIAKETGADSTCKVLEALYPDIDFTPQDNRPITERVKTFEDACAALGEDHCFVQAYRAVEGMTGLGADLYAYLKLRIVAAALNEGWTPDWGNKDECKWYPWFYILTQEEYDDLNDEEKCRVVGRASSYAYAHGGLVCSYACDVSSHSYTSRGARLAFKTKELALYCGKQFGELWASFLVG